MKIKFILVVAILMLSGCSKLEEIHQERLNEIQAERKANSITETCFDGVIYLRFKEDGESSVRGVSVKYTPDGKIATCSK